jgi:hypothetical protein
MITGKLTTKVLIDRASASLDACASRARPRAHYARTIHIFEKQGFFGLRQSSPHPLVASGKILPDARFAGLRPGPGEAFRRGNAKKLSKKIDANQYLNGKTPEKSNVVNFPG